LEHALNFGVPFLGVGETVAVKGDDRLSDTHASQHGDIYQMAVLGLVGMLIALRRTLFRIVPRF
jgi:hypothetical protein